MAYRWFTIAGLCIALVIVARPAFALPALDSLTVVRAIDAGVFPRVISHPMETDSLPGDAGLQDFTLVELTVARNWIYAQAGNPFRKHWLNEYFMSQGWYRPMATYDPKRLTEQGRAQAGRLAAAEAKLTRAQLEQHLADVRRILQFATESDDPDSFVDRWGIEAQLASERLGIPYVTADGGTTSDYGLDARWLDRQVTLSELADLSRRDLRILRNWVYARHGRPYTSEDLGGFFSTLIWYEPDPQYTDSRLTALDRRNIKLILDLERKLGGPMTAAEARQFLSGA